MLIAFWNMPVSLNVYDTSNMSPVEKYLDKLEDVINAIPYIGIDASSYEKFMANSICLDLDKPKRLLMADMNEYTIINKAEFARQIETGAVDYQRLLQIEDPDCVYYLTTYIPMDAVETHFLPGSIERLNFQSPALSENPSDYEKQIASAADAIRRFYDESLLAYAHESSSFMELTDNPDKEIDAAKSIHVDMLKFLGYVGYFYYADLRTRLDPNFNMLNQKTSWQFALAELIATAQQYRFQDVLDFAVRYELWKCHPAELKNAPEDFNLPELQKLYHDIIATTPEIIRAYNHIYQYKVSRNDLCPCGSGKKVKHCHGL